MDEKRRGEIAFLLDKAEFGYYRQGRGGPSDQVVSAAKRILAAQDALATAEEKADEDAHRLAVELEKEALQPGVLSAEEIRAYMNELVAVHRIS
ncbi:MAG: hypothetical protein JWL80_220 [Parcubacteria group bacterium]|nr:hypothetical protein [Parcubacteria group bacterium]